MITRSGNALIMAFGIAAMIGTMVVISTTSSTQVVVDTTRRTLQLRCIAAVEAALHARESAVVAMAADGSLLTWTGDVGQPANFGEDYVGGCRVRWKIEPMRTWRADEAPNSPTILPYISNPSPNPGTPVLAVDEINNSVTYLYRIAAEAAILDGSGVANAPLLARAQGVRALAASNNPLFRYVIFYAATGPKGDLEISHGPALNIQGNVFSNGSIYIGSNVSATDWNSLSGPTGPTTISTAVPGRFAYVAGMDGVYRLSKPIMYAFLNNVALNNAPPPPGTVGGGLYDLTTAQFANESAPPDLTSFATATSNGRVINPRRILSATGLIPGGAMARTINGITLSSNNTDGNDSRDLQRPAARAWSVTSSTAGSDTFGRLVQSRDTGARGELVDPTIAGTQALEAQALRRVDTDGDPTTDEHEAYVPLFYDAGGNTVDTIPNATPVEVPGTYLKYALGSNAAMRRLADNSGWSVTTPTGGAVGASTSTSLIIRERLVPAVEIWPGTGVSMDPLPSNHPDYLPYAYGKHWRPSRMPAIPIDITENLTGSSSGSAWTGIWTPGSNPSTRRTANEPGRVVSYPLSGTFTMQGGTTAGPSTVTQSMTANIGSSPGQSYSRKRYFARDNWRFLHLKQRHGLTDTQILALPQGLRSYVWIDDDRDLRWQSVSATGGTDDSIARLLGPADWTGIDLQLNSSIPWSPNASGNPAPPPSAAGSPAAQSPGDFDSDFYSVRWDGYLIPSATSSYGLRLKHDDGVRIWVDDQLVYERWDYPGGSYQYSERFALTQNKPARISIDFQEGSGGDVFELQWNSTVATTWVSPPSANLRAAPVIAGFDRTQFQSVTARIDLAELRGQAASLPNHKAGLMVRTSAGTPNMISGRDRYLMFGINSTRGLFLEQRLSPSYETILQSEGIDYWVGEGSYTEGVNPPVAAVAGALGIPTDRTDATYAVTRTSMIKKSAETFTLLTTNDYSTSDVTVNDSSAVTTISSLALDESTAISGLRIGPWTNMRTYSQKVRKAAHYSGSFDYDFVTYRGTFPPSPYNSGDRPAINIFDATATGTTASSIQWAANGGYTLGSKSYSYAPTGTGPYLNRTFDGPNTTYGTYSATKTAPVAYGGDSDSHAVWVPSGGWPAGWSGAAVVAALNGMTHDTGAVDGDGNPIYAAGYQGSTAWHLGNGSGNAPPSSPPIVAPTWSAAELAALGAAPTPSQPTDLDSNPHSFSVATSRTYTLRVENNPFTGAGSRWGASFINQTRPWLSTWGTTYSLAPVTTRSIRPDMWWDASVAPSASTSIQAKSATAPHGNSGWPADDLDPTEMPSGWNWATMTGVWLQIRHDSTTGAVTLWFADGANPPGTVVNPWVEMTTQGISLGATASAESESIWSRSLLAGPCIQSGVKNTPLNATFSEVAVATTENIGNNDGVWDATDWDSVTLPGAASSTARYMASQYQVFYANQDITQDFFSWTDATGAPIADEKWFYQTREFWSQSKTWDDGTDKDLAVSDTTNRRLLVKDTVLDIDCQRLWTYMTSRSFAQATTAVMTGGVVPVGDGTNLRGMFNGLIYAVRTNRYPVNPNLGSTNPWSADGDTQMLPNDTVANQYANLQTMTDSAMFHMGVHKLQPYGLAKALPFRPQQFHHGVMLSNGTDINWGFIGAAANPPLGTGATSFVTPNPLYVRGNFNTVDKSVTVSGNVESHPVPIAIMGDSINFLSNQFTFANYQLDDFFSSSSSFSGAGILANTKGTVVSDTTTTYRAAIVTYNQPTTRARVQEGQSAAVIDTMLFLEDWGPTKTMSYLGSLVVLGSKRYTESFLLNVEKESGQSPFGVIGTDWTGKSMQVYNAPQRVFSYNVDLLTPQGTPPFTPSGVTTASVGGWVRAVQ